VVDKQYWGVGKQIFKDMMDWAKELNHDTVFIYFLHTRPQYAFLRKRAKQVFTIEMYGNQFTAYEISVHEY
ncbi:MAG: hypothetical protein MI808_04010, partial [Pseudomonadales bacterium]|nr:hypothetical protein [Pseudomonadales bacterium]